MAEQWTAESASEAEEQAVGRTMRTLLERALIPAGGQELDETEHCVGWGVRYMRNAMSMRLAHSRSHHRKKFKTLRNRNRQTMEELRTALRIRKAGQSRYYARVVELEKALQEVEHLAQVALRLDRENNRQVSIEPTAILRITARALLTETSEEEA